MDYSSGGSLCVILANVFKTKMEQGWYVKLTKPSHTGVRVCCTCKHVRYNLGPFQMSRYCCDELNDHIKFHLLQHLKPSCITANALYEVPHGGNSLKQQCAKWSVGLHCIFGGLIMRRLFANAFLGG